MNQLLYTEDLGHSSYVNVSKRGEIINTNYSEIEILALPNKI